MTRLNDGAVRALACCAFVLSAACDETTPVSAPSSRAQAVVVQEETASTMAKSPQTKALKQIAGPSKRAPLCAGQMERTGQDLPSLKIASLGAGESWEPALFVPVPGSWTWLNLWAAWCVPCKEELPRLRSWEKRLKQAGLAFELSFMSLDDDERQLQNFLVQQPANGVKSSYWLREGRPRSEWLGAVGLDSDPELPGHLLLDPQGKVRCYVQGAVEDADFDSVRALMTARAPR